ncbi:MAG: hypothetical protein LAN64_19205 [Acidobacteriia bacterium]|nr:hypothetical protein [Terriglobia bacterium]
MRLKLIRSLMLVLAMLSASAVSSAQVFLSVSIAPPPLPVYEQPLCPGEDYIWVPGYWAWSPVGFYWVPGTWALSPEPDLLWTPGYWAFESAAYYWHPGYWGPVIGYYGGIDYGFGYPGTGYYGGYWRDRHFFYNQTVNNVDVARIHYVYRAPVVGNVTVVNRVSYNGGSGGTRARPTAEQLALARERHVAPTSAQVQHEHAASTNRSLLAAENHGRPPIAATEKPAEISGHGVVAARPGRAPLEAPENRAVPAGPSTPARHPENRPELRASRPRTEERTPPAPRAETPRQPRVFERENAPRTERIPHAESAPRTERVPHTERQPHPESAPRTERVPHTERQARPESAPHRENKPPSAGNSAHAQHGPPRSGKEEPRR